MVLVEIVELVCNTPNIGLLLQLACWKLFL